MNNNEISIGIVTFMARHELVKSLIHNIRIHSGDNVDIILIINGDNEEYMNDGYRVEMLNFCAAIKNCYPFFCPEFKSLSKLWNTINIFSRTQYNFIIGDDTIYDKNVIDDIRQHIEKSKSEFFTLNHGFSHFVITKKILHTIGYFDERLLALGEEDGDMVHRHIEIFGKAIDNISTNGIHNSARYDFKPTNAEIHIDNKPLINKKIREEKYVSDSAGIRGMWDFPLKKKWEDYQQYPYEMFVNKNKKNIKKFESLDINYEPV
jgi:hypothetical protein